MSEGPALQTTGLTKHFGGLAALVDVNLTIDPGARHAVIGPNGAGKSTLFNVIAGELPPTAGEVFLSGQAVTRWPVHARANYGLGRTFQRNNLFLGLTAVENVRLAVQRHQRVAHHLHRPLRGLTAVTEAADALLQRVGLLDRRDAPVATLAYGQQRALEIALALAGEPRILLLDEPTAGMSPAETREMTRLIERLPVSLTLLIVEHDMDVIFTLADRITVLHYGQTISEGAPDEVRADPIVQQIYLGAEEEQ